MRTRFLIDDNGDVRQWSDDTMELEIPRHKCSSEEALDYINNKFTRPFDLLSGDPLFRLELLYTEKGVYGMWDAHHVILDGMSFTPVLTQIDMTAAYNGCELEQRPYGLYQAAEDEQASLGTEIYQRAKEYYAEKFAGLDFCTISSAQNGSMGKMARRSAFIDCDVCDGWSKENGVPVNLLFQAAFSHTMVVLSRTDKIAYTTVNHGRMDKRLRKALGMFVKSVPILADESKAQTVIDYIKGIRTELMSTIRYSAYPFNHLCRDLGMTPGVSFNFQAIRGMEESIILGENKMAGTQIVRSIVDDDLSAFIFLTNDEKYEIRIESSSAMNSEETCQKVADAMMAVLCNMMAAPEAQLSDISLVSPADEARILAESKGETFEYDTTETWLDLFRRQVESVPDNVAVVDGHGELTYGQLDVLSDKFRAYLGQKGVKPGEFIAIRMDRDKRFMAAVIGAHKAGVAYMPLDKDYPEERVSFMLEDSGARLLVDESAMDESAKLEAVPAAPMSTPDGLAYMIYTSGSTGKPKGVMIQHKSLLNFIHFIRREWRLDSNSRIACHSNFAFDAAVEDLYPVLTVGGAMFVLPESVRMDITLLREYLEANHINGGCYTTQLGQLLGACEEKLDLGYICLGGEKMTAVPNVKGRVLNTYGPTEFTVDATYFEVDPSKTYDNIPIGRPLYNISALILDANGHLLPQGFVGELCLAGPQMAKGYWNRPDLTAKAFKEACVNGLEGKVYHTGDLARYNADGQIEYMGRIDFQVKLRGFRIELGEIENRASQYGGVQMVAAEVKNGQTLCLYFTAATQIDTAALSAFMAETLADYMVPNVFMQLDEMPLTPNGKVNRKALPEPEYETEDIVAPETEEEKRLFGVVSELLKTDKFGVSTNLVSVGLSSLAAMRLAVAIQRTLGIQVKMADVMKHPTIRGIISLYGSSDGSGVVLKPYAKQKLYPLSENQRGVYLEWEKNRDTTQYNIPYIYRFKDVDVDKLTVALRAVVDAHSYVKTRLVMTADDVMQQPHYDEQAVVVCEKLAQEPDAAFFQAQVRPFNVFDDTLYRLTIYESPESVYLLADFHHLVYDGLSAAVFLGDVLSAYNGGALQEECLTAFDFSLYEKDMLADKNVMAEADAHFDSVAGDTNSISYPLSSHPDGVAACHLTHSFEAEDIQKFCSANNVTVGSFLQAAFAVSMSILTREDNPYYLTVNNGRGANASLSRSVGMFVRTLPVSAKNGREGQTVVDYVRAMHEQLQKSYELDFYPYTRVVERHRHNAQVMFVYQGSLDDDASIDGIEQIPLTLDTAKFPLDISVYPEDGCFTLLVEYDGTMYSRHDMEILAKAISCAAVNMASAEKMSDISLVSPADEARILAESKGETFEYDTTETWLDLFRRQVESVPDNVAVVDGHGELTYGQLDVLSDKFRAYLGQKGVKPGEFIAIRMDRDKRFMAAVIGAHKAGVAYMPLDKDYPEERVSFMLEDSGARLLVDESAMDESAKLEAVPAAPMSTPDGLAYMIYTSGSTGKPKGVMIQHKSLLNFIHFIRREWRLDSNSRIACHSNFAFDAAVEDLYPVLTVGGAMFVLPESVRMDITLLREYLEANHINGGCYTTQLGQLLGACEEKLDLGYICLGGEKMTAVPNVKGRVLNTYGPTEFTVDATYFEVDPSKTYDNIPIGRPLYNISALILDANGHLLPQGFVGELCLAGPQMAKGYWNRPDLTAKAFKEACVNGLEGKVYHTGDLARYNADGQIEYMGRIDFQVKLRGFRIELGEIENRASQYGGVQMVAAEVKNGQTLCLYFTAATQIDTAALSAFMAETLADYMVPNVFMQLDEMPLTPNGKVNRKALPEPVIASRCEYVEPATAQEQKVADVMRQILGLESPVGALDNFFELGGDSIKAIRMVSKLRHDGVNIQVSDVMKEKTVRAIAAKSSDDVVKINQEAWSGEVRDSAIGAYFWNLNLPNPSHYLQTLMLDCKERVDVAALQNSLNAITTQHDMLRAVVENNHLVVRPSDAVITVEEQTVATGSDIHDAASVVQANIDMATALLRVVVFHAIDKDYLLIVIHHLVVDGVSWRIILSDLEAAYGQAVAGKEIVLPAKTHSYRDFVEAQHQYLASYKLSLETPYWDKQQEKMLSMPTSDGKDYDRKFRSLTVSMGEADTKSLLTANMQALGLDINDMLIAGVSRSFASMTGSHSVSFLLEGHGREEMQTPLTTDRTVGWFTSEYPVVVEGLTGDCRHDLRATKETLRRIPNKGIGYNILKYLGNRYDTDRLAQINFNYLGEMDAEQNGASGSRAPQFSLSKRVFAGDDFAVENCAGPDLNINCEVKHGCFELSLSYNSGRYSADAARDFSENILDELRSIIKFLAGMTEKEVTASDLGEAEWTDEEFQNVVRDFAGRGEEIERIYPLLPMQEGMLLKALADTESLAYRMVSIFELDTVVDEKRMRDALDKLAEKHEVLRTAIIHDGVSVYRQAIVKRRLALRMADITDVDDKYAALMKMRHDIMTNDYDLQRKPLMQITCVKTAEDKCCLIIATHHIIEDGWCMMLYLRDLIKYLTSDADNEYESLDGKYEAAVREILAKDKPVALDYWKNFLADYDTRAEIPSWGDVPKAEQYDCCNKILVIDKDMTAALTTLCQHEQATISNAVELIWGLVLQTYSRTDDAVFAKVVSGRDNTKTDVNDVVGLFINSIPVRVKCGKDSTARQMLSLLQKQSADSNAYDYCPLVDIQQQSELGSQLFQTVMAFENYNSGDSQMGIGDGGIHITPVNIDEEIFDELNVTASVNPDGCLALNVVFNNKHYRECEIDRVLALFKTLAEGIIHNPDAELSSLPRLSADDERKMAALSSGATVDYDTTETWIDMFERHVKSRPDHIAIVASNGQLTYKELDEESSRLASHLVEAGVKPNDFVAIKMGRVKEFVVAVMGIQKARAAYVPIDPEYPEDRIAYMLEDSEAKMTLTEDTFKNIGCPTAAVPGAKPDDHAYMIYTSGSTGKPKGVVVDEKSVRACAEWNTVAFGLCPGKSNLHHPSFSFDASTFDLYYPLCAGATVHVLSEPLRKDLDGMARYIKDNGITGMTMSTALGMVLLNQYDLGLEYIMLGGEKFMPVKKTDTKLFNGFGPTEFTCCSSYHVIDQDKDIDIPIGRAVPNAASYICDAEGHLLPQGVQGELCLAGVQTANCYWHRDELTAEKFRTLTIAGKPVRVYRTGDLCRYNEDGELMFLGRIDFQVKLRGFRVELGEIENRASQFDGMTQVAAEVKTVNGQQHLVLYFSADTEMDTVALQSFMAETLTEYMVPDVFMQLDVMPMTPGGKINRKALPMPEIKSSKEYVEPEDEAEKAVAQAMQQILATDGKVGALDNFFELGGDSIKAIRLVSLLRQVGINVQVADVMKLKTVRAIAASGMAQTVSISQEPWSGVVDDSPIISFFKDLRLHAPSRFHQSVLLRCNGKADVAILQKCMDTVVRQHDTLRAVFNADERLEVRGADTRIDIIEKNVDASEDINAVVDACIGNLDMHAALFIPTLLHTIDGDMLLMATHHAIVDGVSWRVIMGDMELAYQQCLAGQPIVLPEKTNTYNDYVCAVEKYRDSYALSQEIPYWNSVQERVLALGSSDGKDLSRHFDRRVVRMGRADTQAFKNAKLSMLNADVNDILLTAVGRSYVANVCDKSNAVSVQMEGHGREPMGTGLYTDRTVGWFTSVYPVVIDGIGGDIHSDLRRVKEMLHRIPNKGVGYNILRFVGGENAVSYPSDKVAKIGFNYLGEMDADDAASDGFFTMESYENVSSGDEDHFGPDLTINCEIADGEFSLVLDYNSVAYTEEVAQRFAAGILGEINNIVALLSGMPEKEVTASDLGETEWSDEEFRKVEKDFASRGERLQRIYPLTPMQEGMLMKHLEEPTSWAYRLTSIYEADFMLTQEQMENALGRLAKKHEVLRTAIVYDGVEKFRQAIVDRKLRCSIVDVSDKANPEAEARKIREDIMTNGYDLQRKSLLQVVCAKKSDNSCYFIISTHHIIIDGWCLRLYMNDLMRFMQEEITGVGNDDYEALDGRYETAVRDILSKDKGTALGYWRELLSGYETRAEIPSWGDVPEAEQAKDSNMSIVIDRHTTYALTDLCQHEQATMSNAVELIWGLVLQTYSRTNDAIFAKVVSGRDNTNVDVSEVVGLFINSVPVRVKCEKGCSARQMLSVLQLQAAETNRYDFCALAEIQRQSELGSRLLQTVMAYENYNSGLEADASVVETSGHIKRLIDVEENFDELNVNASVDENGCLAVQVIFNNKHYRECEIERVLALFKTFAEGIAHNPDAELASLPRLSADDERKMAALSSGATVDYDTTETWIDMFERHVKSRPDHIAIVASNGQLTYKELDEESSRLASHLVEAGVKPNDFVAIKMGRVKEFVVAVMGIQKARAAYVPIDPEYPEDRIAYMLEDSEAKMTLTEDTFKNIGCPTAAVPGAKPDDHAYMIYTSGSTGKPKGVVVDEKSVRACAEWNTVAFGLCPGKSNLHHPSFSFDASTFDLYYPLCAGATVHVLSEPLRKDLDGMARYIKDNGITGMTMSTALGMVLLNQYDLGLEYIMLGGEKFMPVKKTDTKLFNGFGPTEFTCCSSYHVIDQDKDIDIPIGRAVPNAASYICDAEGHLLPQGVQGELCLAGVQTANCYWHRDELTAEKFRTLTIAGKPVRVYRTGDLCRYNEDGELMFLGRIDFQVKLRGFRVELGEIENRASQFDGMTQVAAEVKTVNGQQHLVLYFSADTEMDTVALQSFMAETLTEYMVPDVFMQLDVMPMTPGGKINRKALPMPMLSAATEENISPETPVEQNIFDVVAEQLKTSGFGVTNNLVGLGLSSLMAMRLCASLQQRFGYVVKVADVMRKPTVRAIAAFVSDSSDGNSNALKAYDKREVYPITGNQRGVYLDWEMNRNTTQYNIPAVYRFDDINVDRLAEAAKAAVEAHSYLKVRLVKTDVDVMQQRHDGDETVVGVSVLDAEPDVAFFQKRIVPFDLFNDRLYRIEIYKTPTSAYLFLDIHHVVYDGLSSAVFLQDMMRAYNGEKLEPEHLTACDYAIYEQELSDGESMKKAEGFFDTVVDGANVLSYPKSLTPDGVAENIVKVSCDAKAIDAFCSSNGVTVGSFMHAAFAEAMRRVTREEKPLYLTVNNGRSASVELLRCVGMFVKTLPVAAPVNIASSVDYVKAMHEQLLQTYEWDFYPYTKLVERHGLKAEVMFVYQGNLAESGKMDGFNQLYLSLDTTKFPITVMAYPEGGEYTLYIEYDGNLYSQADMEVMGNAVLNAMMSLATVDNVADVQIVSDKEREEISLLGKGEELMFDKSQTLVDLIRDSVAKTPDACAVVFHDVRLTYRQLDEVTDKLAVYLAAHGVRQEVPVGVMIDRSEYMAIYPIAVMKAGGTYMPLDNKFPEERLAYMCEDAGVKFILSDDGIVNKAMPHYEGTVFQRSEMETLPEVTAEQVAALPKAKPNNMYVLLYTSGSTGKPKGVALEHHNIVNFCHCYLDRFKLVETDRCMAYANFGFDVHMMDIYAPLYAGASVYIIDSQMRMDLVAMNRYMEENRITFGFMTTQIGYIFATTIENKSLRLLIVGGEKLKPLKKPRFQLYNAYGPTECTICCTAYDIDKDYDSSLIGRPIPNYQLFVVDSNMRLVPRGVPGELVICGDSVGRGYLHPAEKDANKFCEFNGMKAYRTGDLVRWSPDGNIDFIGRIDNQVKLRGLRIELGEIEARILQKEEVNEACVVVKTIAGVENLVCYYALKEGCSLSVADLKAFLEESLTQFMVPEIYILIDKLPLTTNGKINHRALPEPKVELEEIVKPETITEKKLFAIVSEHLKMDNFGVTNNLISLGLSSLAAMRLGITIQNEMGYEMNMNDLMKSPNIRAIAKMMDDGALKKVSSMRLGDMKPAQTAKPNPLQKRETPVNPLENRNAKPNPLQKRENTTGSNNPLLKRNK